MEFAVQPYVLPLLENLLPDYFQIPFAELAARLPLTRPRENPLAWHLSVYVVHSHTHWGVTTMVHCPLSVRVRIAILAFIWIKYCVLILSVKPSNLCD
jgi:hypothetical protein